MKILTAWLRIYKSFGGEKWKSNVILTSFLCPGIVFGHFFIMNLVRIQPLLEWCSECSGGCWSECSVWRWFIIFSLESWKVRSIYETFFQRPLFVFLSSLFHFNDLIIHARLHALHLYPQVLWYYGSSAAIPFFTLVALLALWFGVSVPLTFVGAYFGFRL